MDALEAAWYLAYVVTLLRLIYESTPTFNTSVCFADLDISRPKNNRIYSVYRYS